MTNLATLQSTIDKAFEERAGISAKTKGAVRKAVWTTAKEALGSRAVVTRPKCQSSTGWPSFHQSSV